MKNPKTESIEEFMARGGEVFHIEDGYAAGSKGMAFHRTRRSEFRAPVLGATKKEMAKGRMITSVTHAQLRQGSKNGNKRR